MDRAYLEQLLASRAERNGDNVSRTESYLELYAYTRARPPELPWLLMAHLVSRNAGYLMADVAESLAPTRGRGRAFTRGALEALFLFLERANFLIFHDAWWHVLHHLLGESAALDERTPRFVRDAWWRYEAAPREGRRVAASTERALVLDLVTNEQHFIERRVVHHARFEAPRAMIAFVEGIGREASIVLPAREVRIVVGGFTALQRRIEAGRRIFDESLADPARRKEAFEWSLATPHSGSRVAHGGRPAPGVRDAWPIARVRALWDEIHADPEPDPTWP